MKVDGMPMPRVVRSRTRGRARARAYRPLTWLTGLVLAGYPLVAAATSVTGVDNRSVSLVFRVVVVGLSLAVIARMASRRSRIFAGAVWFPIATFWMLYIVRLALDTYIRPVPLSLEPYEYWMWAVGGCLIPMVALMTRWTEEEFALGLRVSLVIASVASALTLVATFIGVTSGSSDALARGRLALESLNPISLGHLGGSLCILGIHLLLTQRSRRALTFRHGIYAAFGLLGLIVLVLSASRGPFVATTGALLFLLMARSGKKKQAVGVLIVSAVLASGYVLANYVETDVGFAPVTRVLNMMSGRPDEAIMARYASIADAWQQFLASPVVGSGLEEMNSRFYPHNVIVEAFMATGIVGGSALVVIFIAALGSAWRIIRSRQSHDWVAMLFVQYLFAAQFSGSLWGSTILWGFVGAVLAVKRLSRESLYLDDRFRQRWSEAAWDPAHPEPS